MSLKKIVTSATVAVLAAGSFVPLSSVANARDWDGDRHGQRFEHRDHDGGRSNRWNEQRRYGGWRGHDHDDGGYRRHRDNTGRNLAIGAFATILGLAIASQASHANHYYDGDND